MNALVPSDNKTEVIPPGQGEAGQGAEAVGAILVSGEGGAHEIPEDLRHHLAIYSNGTVLVSSEMASKPFVLSLTARAKKAGVPIRTAQVVEPGKIKAAYEADRRNRLQNSAEYTDSARRTKILNMVGFAAKQNASDIHIHVTGLQTTVRMRMDGVLYTVDRALSVAEGHALLQAMYNMADSASSNYMPLEPQPARISTNSSPLPDKVQSLRLQYSPVVNGGRYLVIRLLYEASSQSADIQQLGYAREHVEMLKRMIGRPYGVNLVAGPTGSGKSTTLVACLNFANEQKNGQIAIYSVEDPPEYILPFMAQVPLTAASTAEERKAAFTKTVNSILRSDPNIVMLSEVRDEESGKMAFEMAMTGIQLWSTIHVTNAPMILNRLRDLGVEKFKVYEAETVTGLIAQRLMRKLCPACKQPLRNYANDPKRQSMIERAKVFFGEEWVSAYTGTGYKHDANGRLVLDETRQPIPCPHCRAGYKDRTVCSEIIIPDDQFMQLMKDEDMVGARKYWIEELQGATMLDHGAAKVMAGLVGVEEVERVLGFLPEKQWGVSPERRLHVLN